MLKEFKQHIEQQFSFLEGSNILIAISGGIDSVVLAHLCHQLDFNISLCHCNFQLRGQESDDDEAFVMQLANQLRVNLFTTRFNTEEFAKKNKISIQVAARNLRYEWFYQLIQEHSYDYVLTAHNTNDNLETFLINLTRGTGLEGFTGIPPVNNKSVRPLLAFSRDEIREYATQNAIIWREDQSNASTKYLRNKIRHQILPILEEMNSNVLESFQKTIGHLQESQEIVNDRIQEVSERVLSFENDLVKIDLKILNTLNNKKAYLYQLLNSYGFTEWNDVIHLVTAQPGKQLFSKTHRLLKDRDFLILADRNHIEQEVFQIKENEQKIKKPIQLFFEETNEETPDNQNTIIIDKNLLKYPLIVRKWESGDYICPTGMTGSKKLSQLFKDQKLSLIQKEQTWLLTNADNTIIWVIGMRQDRRFSVLESTTQRLKISYIQ